MRATPAEALDALIESCITSNIKRQALLLRIDRLPPGLSRPHHLRLAEAALRPLMSMSRAQMFHLPGPTTKAFCWTSSKAWTAFWKTRRTERRRWKT